MYGVVLAAGEGTRLRPRTAERPKGLVEVAGQPLLTHCFETLRALGVDELVVVVGYQGEQIVSYYGDRFGDLPLTYAHQTERRGLADALLTAESRADLDADFLVLNGDNVCRANLGDVLDRHRNSAADATLLVDEVSRADAAATGVVSFDDEGNVAGLVEKPDDPPSTTVPRGFYAFSPRIFEACRAIDPSPTGEYELTAAVDWLLDDGGRVETVGLEGWCVNVNTEADRTRAEKRLQRG
ncbi:UTP--glucose-1-phosphate uridylyltransferase [Salinigranum rubrum]|uniref:UTP--glucose-1-phosphate uridylyltransferase n=1 Tax=Salinigranum rubrum TaxID=755307 RepID=A0A2I8VM46_9EURY|nr:sugar nucleotidyltransferase [Salinigranum rubrum]AUV82954.1 UTP--glucose-1-phosphate uridylyltransferase [Salinigranum rubrum]